MFYLIPTDYEKQIQADNLKQVISNTEEVLDAAELLAIAEARSFLVQKYDLALELAATLKWNSAATYPYGKRVYLDPPAYQSQVYAEGAYVTYGKKVYKANQAIAVDAFDPDKWTYVCPQYQIFSAGGQLKPFYQYTRYDIGDQVIYGGVIYTALKQTEPPYWPAPVSSVRIESVPRGTVFPPNSDFWTTGAVFSVPALADITDFTWWWMGDNRDQELVAYIVDLALYHVHSRISPRNIPDLREKRYDDAIKKLKMFAKGDATAGLPQIQPLHSGMRIRHGGLTKQANGY